MTEMWERFSFYGMRALLVLYMIAQVGSGGLGWTYGEALSLYGTYLGVAWLTPLAGGVIADRWLGQRNSVLLGGVLMAVGLFTLAFGQQLAAFYIALTVLAIGVGFFKPCITVILGGLYKPGDARRDSGFSIFYMGINIGGFLASIICGWLQVTYGFRYGFLTAAIGMLLGLGIFLYGFRYLGDAGKKPVAKKQERRPLNAEEKQGIALVVLLCTFLIAFIIAYEQAGGLLSIYAQDYTNREFFGFEVPTAWFQALNPLMITMGAPIVSVIWMRLARKRRDLSVATKMGIGFLLTGVSFLFMVGAAKELGFGAKSSLFWLVGFNVFSTFGELCIMPVLWSAVTKLSPKHLVSTLMAISLGAIGFGSKLAGLVGGYIEKLGPLQLFASITVAMFAFSIVMIMANKKLMALSGDRLLNVEEAGTLA
ncbi:peptide MFS transporter [Simkania negevensis]|uniref:Peptide MFS transporter n=1 Tax=Simkania negevensis TaxID=83561 RepID=A0ABS3AT94_9BACT|nr:peptide MFS transporter [Simkania negevensis]